MPDEVLKQINWVDIFIVTLLLRVYYVSFKNGLYAEFFKCMGTLAAAYLGLHYYTLLTNFLVNSLKLKSIPLEFLDFLTFLFLVLLGYGLFALLRQTFTHFFKIQVAGHISQWGGLLVGILRGFLLTSLITYILVISSVAYLRNSAHTSYLGRGLFKIAPSTYSWLWNNILSKINAGEEFNKTVTEVENSFYKT